MIENLLLHTFIHLILETLIATVPLLQLSVKNISFVIYYVYAKTYQLINFEE